jgi:hypothetical protein
MGLLAIVGMCREGAMRDALVSGWARESHFSVETLGSLHELNHRFLDLASARTGAWASRGQFALPPDFVGQVASLSPSQRAAAANCPYALFDMRFQDDGHWQLRLQNAGAWRVADEPAADADTFDFVQLALFYTWHVATTAKLAAQLILGMNEPTAAAFGRITVNCLPALVATETINLTARWSHCGTYWSALAGAASRPDARGLRRAQLFGVQLAAAARLS